MQFAALFVAFPNQLRVESISHYEVSRHEEIRLQRQAVEEVDSAMI